MLYFIWGTFLNFGHLNLEGEAPFTVTIYKTQKVNCLTSPCSIKLKSGNQKFIVEKDGYHPLTSEAAIKLWNTENLRLAFDVIPELLRINSVPLLSPAAEDSYELIVDELTGTQKLINKEDKLQLPIIYFQNPLKEVRIFGNYGKYLLIATKNKELFKVDLRAKSREKIEGIDPSNIEDGTFSPSGRYFLFKDKNSNYLELLDTKTTGTNRFKFTFLQSSSTRYDWLYDDSIVFLSTQSYSDDIVKASVAGNLISPLAKKSTSSLLLGKYSPFYDEYTKFDIDLPLSSFPDSFISALSGSEVYLQKGDEKFKIILRKF